MRVLQISNHLYPKIGGIEQVARDIAGVLTKENIPNKIICFNETAESDGISCKRKETVIDYVDGVEVHRCGCICRMASQSFSLTFGRELEALMDDFEPQAVIFHYPNPFQAIYLLRQCRKRGFKLVLYWHLDITKQKLLGKLFHRQTVELLKRADAIVATSPNYIEGSPFLSRFKEKCIVIPNCISTGRLAVTPGAEKTAARLRQENRGRVVCFAVGRHVEYKGMRYLIEASRYLDDRFVVYIGGSGELTGQLKAQAAGDEKVHFTGRLSDEELMGYYEACDIFCFPSITKNEAFGIALAEGMYFGKPAVTFTIPGSGVNFVNQDGKTGIECPNGDSKAYAGALQKLADDAGLRKEYGRNACQWVMDNFTTEQFEKNICALLDML